MLRRITDGGWTCSTRILVPTDFSAPSDAALEYARTVATRFGASLHLLHVAEDPIAPSTDGSLFPPKSRRCARRSSPAPGPAEGQRTPEDVSELHATADAIIGTPAWSIVEYAGAHDIDLIVMGTHGRGGMSHLVIGSVAEAGGANRAVSGAHRPSTGQGGNSRCQAGGGHGSAARAHGDHDRGQAVLSATAGGEAELLDAVAHLVAIDAEQLAGLRLIAAGSLERLHQQLPLDLVEVDAFGRQLELRRRRPTARQRR